ncbi:hypothetical protein F4778DRAFT_727509 [Xylariomycetidae sp. FL2044]|nr:hypothetical protein F4778DRAFT_727509 [Xylariomycetidae sp. FL2044]
MPVTDGTLIQARPRRQLHFQRKVNRVQVLTGNSMNEGVAFLPRNITSKTAFKNLP